MRMKGAKQVHYDAGPNMTPLVDVVMVILIFLMLAGKFGGDEHYLASTVPVRNGGSGDPKSVVPKDVDFHIAVDTLTDRFSARVDGVDDPITDIPTLVTTLGGRLGALLNNGHSPDDIQVLISPGKTVKYVFLIQVYEAALTASTGSGDSEKHFTKVAFQESH